MQKAPGYRSLFFINFVYVFLPEKRSKQADQF